MNITIVILQYNKNNVARIVIVVFILMIIKPSPVSAGVGRGALFALN